MSNIEKGDLEKRGGQFQISAFSFPYSLNHFTNLGMPTEMGVVGA
jgi:hypothetical protein